MFKFIYCKIFLILYLIESSGQFSNNENLINEYLFDCKLTICNKSYDYVAKLTSLTRIPKKNLIEIFKQWKQNH